MKLVVFVLLISFVFTLSGCGPKQLYLINQPHSTQFEDADILNTCLKQAMFEMNTGAPPLTEKQKESLKGVSTEYFIWWGSMSGPRAVVNQQGLPGEARTSFPVLDENKKILSRRYVSCLMENGFTWPDGDWVKERFNETE